MPCPAAHMHDGAGWHSHTRTHTHYTLRLIDARIHQHKGEEHWERSAS
jgi:hypothetical protein